MAVTFVVETTINPGVQYEVSQAEYQRLLELGLLLNGPSEPVAPGVFDLEVSALLDDVNSQTYGKVVAFPPGPHQHPSTDISDSGSVGRALLATTSALSARAEIGAVGDADPRLSDVRPATDASVAALVDATDSATAERLRAASVTAVLESPDVAAAFASLEGLTRSHALAAGVFGAQESYLGPVSFPERIGGFSMAFSGAIAASDTDYWTISLIAYRGGQRTTVASKTTQAVGGEAITPNTTWTFDNIPWPSVLRYLRRGDVLAVSFAATGAPAGLLNPTMTVRYEPNLTPLGHDAFGRSDADVLGLADSGQAWAVMPVASGTQSVFGIRSGVAAVIAATGAARDYARLPVGLDNYTAIAKLLSVSTAGLGVRLSTGANGSPVGYIHNAGTLFRIEVGGGLTSIGALASALANGDIVAITCSGSTISVYRNGILGLQVTDTTWPTGDAGLRATNPALGAGLWENFAVAA